MELPVLSLTCWSNIGLHDQAAGYQTSTDLLRLGFVTTCKENPNEYHCKCFSKGIMPKNRFFLQRMYLGMVVLPALFQLLYKGRRVRAGKFFKGRGKRIAVIESAFLRNSLQGQVLPGTFL